MLKRRKLKSIIMNDKRAQVAIGIGIFVAIVTGVKLIKKILSFDDLYFDDLAEYEDFDFDDDYNYDDSDM